MEPSPVAAFERPAAPALRWAVRSLWSIAGHLEGEAVALPKPSVDLVFSLADPHLWRTTVAAGPALKFADGWVTSVQSGPRTSRALGETMFVGARLEPFAAKMIFGPLPFGDGTPPIAAEALLGREARQLRERLGEARDMGERIDILENWLAAKLGARRGARREPVEGPAAFPGAMVAAESNWRVDDLCSILNVSPRTLRRQFEGQCGFSPKYWLRLERMSALVADPRFQNGDSVADTAARFGFFDQAHLAGEFRRLGGVAPSVYRVRRTAAGISRLAPTMVPAGWA